MNHRSAQERRAEFQAVAAAQGIDLPYVSTLVDEFYSRIRVHPELGPIFEGVIGEEWEPHLEKMKAFWASVALQAGTYSGKPVPAHQKLEGVTPEHFQMWLSLFRATLQETAPTSEAAEYFRVRAERIAESLQLAMFGMPGLPGHRPLRSQDAAGRVSSGP